ncbi:hypothetical protein [Inconstantimicrobium mannanitabidum]|uniref:Uncharacterized protein n=1 Tax=Inconstantimicrobium mannanitabidum TaxID=1604901 RepID=A0ACB5RIT9_9CLOT|nr:hypothetical protein [Clostridium sp. TW13]GKX69004.1 hypothetical protein rsdtw13_42620 [Clostridium sp. TW13]
MNKMIKPLSIVLGVCLCAAIYPIQKNNIRKNAINTSFLAFHYSTSGQAQILDPGIEPPKK